MLSCRLRKKLYHIFNYVFVRSTFITNAGIVLPPHLHLHLHFHSSHFPIFFSLFTHIYRLCIIALSLSQSLFLLPHSSYSYLPYSWKKIALRILSQKELQLCAQYNAQHTIALLLFNSPTLPLTQSISLSILLFSSSFPSPGLN